MKIINIENLRKNKQKINNATVKNHLLNYNIPLKEFFDVINKKELQRLLNDLNYDFEQLHQKCLKDLDFCIVVSRQISKLASRQGVSDELLILSKINDFTSKLGVFVNKPKEDLVINEKQIVLRKESKNFFFRSIDAIITGKLKGYVFSKVILGKGSTQENSWTEAKLLISWAINSQFKENLIFLIDTDNLTEFKKLRFSVLGFANIKILSHISFQIWVLYETI